MRDPIRCPVQHPGDVRPCDPRELDPLLAWLAERTPVERARAFTRGTALPDGRLDLCKQALGPLGLRRVLDSLSPGSGVRHLLLGTNGLGDEGARAVADFVADGGRLETVFLGCNAIGASGAAALTEALERDAVARALWLKRNPLGDEGALAVARLLRRSTSLRTIDLVDVALGRAGLEAIVRALVEENRTVTRLYLGCNRLDAFVAPLLADLVRGAPGLRSLLLSSNLLGDDGCEQLAAALAVNTTLRTLGLASNGIGPRGAAALAAAVPTSRLAVLDLSRARSTAVVGAQPNRLGDEGARVLADMLRGDPPLERLDLRGAGVRGRGARALAEALDANRTVYELRLGKHAPRRVKRRIAAALEARRPSAATRDDPGALDASAIRSVYRTR